MKTTDIKLRIEENLNTRDKLLESTANLIADFVINGSSDRNRSQLETDIKKLLTGYTDDEMSIIYLKALTIVGKNLNNSSGSRSGRNNSGGNSSAAFLRNKR